MPVKNAVMMSVQGMRCVGMLDGGEVGASVEQRTARLVGEERLPELVAHLGEREHRAVLCVLSACMSQQLKAATSDSLASRCPMSRMTTVCGVILSAPSSRSLATRAGVPTAIATRVLPRNLTWSATLKCFAKSCCQLRRRDQRSERHPHLGNLAAWPGHVTDSAHDIGAPDAREGENEHTRRAHRRLLGGIAKRCVSAPRPSALACPGSLTISEARLERVAALSVNRHQRRKEVLRCL